MYIKRRVDTTYNKPIQMRPGSYLQVRSASTRHLARLTCDGKKFLR